MIAGTQLGMVTNMNEVAEAHLLANLALLLLPTVAVAARSWTIGTTNITLDSSTTQGIQPEVYLPLSVVQDLQQAVQRMSSQNLRLCTTADILSKPVHSNRRPIPLVHKGEV
jgi:hypothetical protein